MSPGSIGRSPAVQPAVNQRPAICVPVDHRQSTGGPPTNSAPAPHQRSTVGPCARKQRSDRKQPAVRRRSISSGTLVVLGLSTSGPPAVWSVPGPGPIGEVWIATRRRSRPAEPSHSQAAAFCGHWTSSSAHVGSRSSVADVWPGHRMGQRAASLPAEPRQAGVFGPAAGCRCVGARAEEFLPALRRRKQCSERCRRKRCGQLVCRVGRIRQSTRCQQRKQSNLWLLSEGNRNQAAQHTRLGSAGPEARSSSLGGWEDIRRDTVGSRGARHTVRIAHMCGPVGQPRYAHLGPAQWSGWAGRLTRAHWEGPS
jgi:hypothetical protein